MRKKVAIQSNTKKKKKSDKTKLHAMMAQMDGKMLIIQNKMKEKTKKKRTRHKLCVFSLFVSCVHKRRLCSTFSSLLLLYNFFVAKIFQVFRFANIFGCIFIIYYFLCSFFSFSLNNFTMFFFCMKKALNLLSQFERFLHKRSKDIFQNYIDSFWWSILIFDTVDPERERGMPKNIIYQNNNGNRNVCVWCDPSIY